MTIKKGAGIATIDVNLVTFKAAGETNEMAITTSPKIAIAPEINTEDAKKLVIKGILVAQKNEVKTLTGNTITLTDNVFTPELVKLVQGGTISWAATQIGLLTAGILLTSKDLTKVITIALVKPDTANASLGVVVTDDDIVVNLATDAGKVATSTATLIKAAIEALPASAALVEVALVSTGAGVMLPVAKMVIPNSISGYTPPVAGSAEKGSVFELCAYSAQYDASGQIVQYEKIAYPNCQGAPISLSSEDGVFRVSEYTIMSAPNTGQAPYALTYVAALPTVI